MEQPRAQSSQPNGRSNHLLLVVDEQSRQRLGVKCVARPWLLAYCSSLPLTVMSQPRRCQKCHGCRWKPIHTPARATRAHRCRPVRKSHTNTITIYLEEVSFTLNFCKVERRSKRLPRDVDRKCVMADRLFRAEAGMLGTTWKWADAKVWSEWSAHEHRSDGAVGSVKKDTH